MARSRTPPDVKWVANELAASAGELERIDAEMARLQDRKARLIGIRQALSQVASQMKLAELPCIVPPVRAHGKYQGRGNLKNWIQMTLKAAYPNALDTNTLVDLAVETFELNLGTVPARNQFRRNSLGKALRKMLCSGVVERLHDFQGVPDMAGVWRWKAEFPELTDMLEGLNPEHVGFAATGPVAAEES